MADSTPFACCCCLLFLFFSLLVSSSHVHGRESIRWHTAPIRALLPETSCSSTKDPNPSKMTVVHPHGPCSPLSQHQKPSHQQILDQDQSRVDSLHRRTSIATKPSKVRGSLAASIPAQSGSSLGTGNYIVTVGFGTPAKQYSVVFDTGSDITWIQCKPCVSCYQQQDPLFDPSQSSTYHNVSCASNACTLLDAPECSAASTCRYTVEYGDNSETTGPFVQDTLTLTSSDVIPSFLFGCGDQNSGLFGLADGLIGLGRQKVSLVSQATAKYGGVFSYCLPSTSSATGYLKLGGGAPANVKFTQMLTYSSLPTFYFLNLIAISVGGRRLPIPSTVFSNAGILIDSGTVISRLPPSAYSKLSSAFRQVMQSYPPAPSLSILDTCYNFTGYGTVTVPSVVLLFGNGVSVNVDFSGILYVASVEQACLAFAPNDDDGEVGIVGNMQQQRFSVVYDVPNRLVGFGAGGCS